MNKRKYIVVLTDGAADYKIDELSGKTVYEKAEIPNLDEFAKKGRLFTVKTVPEGYKPGIFPLWAFLPRNAIQDVLRWRQQA